MEFYLIYPLETQLKQKDIFELAMGVANVVLIISSNFSIKNIIKKYAFTDILSYLVTEPKLVNEKQIEKYKAYVDDFFEENPNFSIGSNLIFLAIPENEYCGQTYNKDTLIILDKVALSTKKKFNNYDMKIVDDY